MTISIIIPAYNEENYVGRTLDSIKSLEKNKDWAVEVLIVNGSSTDKTKEIALRYNCQVLDVEKRGIGFARQQGLLHVDSEIVAYTDGDTVVPPDWLIKHVSALGKPGVVMTCGNYRVTDGYFPYYHFINYIQPKLFYLSYRLTGRVFAASGQNIAFWRDKALSIGGFDENLKVMEDTDMARRMTKVGKVVMLKDSCVYSSGRRSKEGWGMFWRMIKTIFSYYLLQNRNLALFPDYR